MICASAGGLDAFKKLLSHMPADSGMALVLIPHLDPRHESLMVELLRKQTLLPIQEARQRMAIRPDNVYVIPPNKFLAIERNRLILSAPPGEGHRAAIDFALRSVAADRKEKAIGIVLSGTGSSGTEGLKEIKRAGGIVIVQDPATAQYDQMPSSALGAVAADYVLAPEQMPEALLRIARSERSERTPRDRRKAKPTEGTLEELNGILAALQTRDNHDFHRYRKSMVKRRIERRMRMLQVDDMRAYRERLRQDPAEVAALRGDLLIGVTAFFREAEAFDVLAESAIASLVRDVADGATIRAWVAGCASGEEAYSIAVLLNEQLRAAGKEARVQMFASDLDEDLLRTARLGVYPDSATADISPERLRRFFDKVDAHHYQAHKQLRESIVFARHNLIKDPPFSRMDLISCRNVLIYLEPDLQAKIIALLHFALKENAYLMLGPSESIGRAVDMFEPVSRKWRLFRRIGAVDGSTLTFPTTGRARRLPEAEPPQQVQPPRLRSPLGPNELMQKLLAEDFAPASVLVNRKYEVLSFRGPLVNYLEFPPGEPTRNLTRLARPDLREKLRVVCRKAIGDGRVIHENRARVLRDGRYVPCTITVQPLTELHGAEGLLLIEFRDRTEASHGDRSKRESEAESATVRQLEEELRATREDLQSTIEELESSNEELKAAHEEVMSINEELQSANEELETSKGELQSLNEELTTINNQLQEKVEDLDRSNADMRNFTAATDIATIFLDRAVCLKRFTPAAARVLGLTASDVGRPFRDIAPSDDLIQDAKRVGEALSPVEKEVHAGNRWYLRRTLPYRGADDRLDGVIVSYIDVTERIAAEAQARRLANVLQNSNDALIVRDLQGRIVAWNRGAERTYGYTEAEALKLNLRDLLPEEYRERGLRLAQQIASGEIVDFFHSQRRTRDGQMLEVWGTITLLRDAAGKPQYVATTERDITQRVHAEEEMRSLNATLEQRVAVRTAELSASENRVRAILDATGDAVLTIDESGRVVTINQAAERMFGYSANEVLGRDVRMLTPAPHREQPDDFLRRCWQPRGQHVIGRPLEAIARRKDGTHFPIQLSVKEVRPLHLFVGFARDLSDHRALQQEVLHIATLEQNRIGQELHDGTQQELTGLGLLAENLSELLAGEGVNPESELAARIADGIAVANRHVRSLARGLVPVGVDAEGLMAALDELARSTAEVHDLTCRFECPAPVRIDDDGVATHLYRIAQEAVTNAIKHGRCDDITIRLVRTKQQLELSVRDNGIGIEQPTTSPQRLGLRLMAHRCELVGGTLTIRKPAQGGTEIACTVPKQAAG